MSWFSFKKKRAHSVALIDIGSASVGGAYVHFVEGEAPVIYYTARVSVETYDGEDVTEGMLRSLGFLEKLLIEEGAPQLHRETGSGAIESVLVSVAAPWQQTKITITHIVERRPFVFSKAHLDAAGDGAKLPKDRVFSRRTAVATILNGYETAHPFGKKATRADIIMLESSLEKETAHKIEASLRHAFHTHAITLTAFAPIAYSAFRDLYPHQKEFFVLDITGSCTDIMLVKRGLLSESRTIQCGIHSLIKETGKASSRAHHAAPNMLDPVANQEFAKEAVSIRDAWLEGIKAELAQLSETQALPRTVFLLADKEVRDYLKRSLEESPSLRKLWLSDEPPSVIAVSPSHIAHYVKTRGFGEADVFLGLLALFAAKGADIHQQSPGSELPEA